MNQVKISIIIPIYNVEPYIAKCIMSVMQQTYQGLLECIVVDDCGTDNSIEIVKKLIAEYDGPIVFGVLHHDHNRGLSAARNTGLYSASGNYVYFLDSDDWISPDCIETLAKPIQNERYDMVIGDYQAIGGTKWPLSLQEGHYYETGITKTFCNKGVYVMAWNKLYSKEFLLKNHLLFEEGRIYEDEIFAFDLSCVDKSFYVVSSVSYYHLVGREGSIGSNKNQTKMLEAYLNVLHCVKAKVNPNRNLEGIYDFYVFFLMRVLRWISRKVNLDDKMICSLNEGLIGCLDVVPNLTCLRNKHNRLFYFMCKKEQTYQRFLYVMDVFSYKCMGRIMRNLLNVLPYRVIH